MKYLKIYEDFKSGKFSVEDLQKAMLQNKGIYADIIKDFPDNDSDKLLKIIDIDEDSNEISVLYDNDIRYVDINDINEIEQ